MTTREITVKCPNCGEKFHTFYVPGKRVPCPNCGRLYRINYRRKKEFSLVERY